MGYGHVQLWLITNRGFEGNAKSDVTFSGFFALSCKVPAQKYDTSGD